MLQALLAANKIGSILKWVVIGVVVYAVYRRFSNRAKENQYIKNDKDAGSSLAKTQADLLRAAMNPSGSAELFDVDGTKTTAIMDIAREIKDYQAVVDAYNERYKGSLPHHLERELSAEDLKRFLALAGAQTNSTVNYSVIKTGVGVKNVVWTLKECNIRSGPRKTGMFEHSNVLYTVQPHFIIGVTTGKTDYDSANDIIFVEMEWKDSKSIMHKYWAAKSQIELIPPADYVKRVKENKENLPFFHLSGVTPLAPEELVTKHAATLYDENLQPCDRVSGMVRLGPPKTFLRLGDRYLIRFTTVDGDRLWIDATDAAVYQPLKSAA